MQLRYKLKYLMYKFMWMLGFESCYKCSKWIAPWNKRIVLDDILHEKCAAAIMEHIIGDEEVK